MIKRYSVLLAVLIPFHIAGCTANTRSPAVGDFSLSPSPAMIESQVSMSGQNGVMTLGGDVVEVKNGKLTVNGIFHGEVAPDALIRYVIRGQTKELFVDGERRPLQR